MIKKFKFKEFVKPNNLMDQQNCKKSRILSIVYLPRDGSINFRENFLRICKNFLSRKFF